MKSCYILEYLFVIAVVPLVLEHLLLAIVIRCSFKRVAPMCTLIVVIHDLP